ncbi:MAG: SH3 domain-containing protein, partial [Chloroflexota bacterium]
EGWVANTVVTTRGDCLSNNVSVRSSSIATGLEGALVTTDGATPAPGVAPTLVPPTIDTTCPEGFVGYLPPRIQTGAVTAQVEQGGLPNTLREGPSTETARVGTIQPGRRIDFVLGGPQCSNGFVWWQVEVDGVQGWTAESSAQDNAYFLAPTPGNEVGPTATVGPTPVPAQDISLGGLIDGTITGLVQRDASLFGMTPVLSAVAGGYAWSDGANLESRLSASTLAGVPRVEWTLEPGQTFTSITNRSNSGETNLIVNDDVLAGTSSGDLIVVERLDQSYTVQVHDAPIMAIELNQSAEILATAAGTSESTTGIPASAPETWRVRIWDEAIIGPDTMDDALMRSIRFPYPPTHVAFSADDQYLVVVAQQTTPEPAAALWIYAETGLGDNTYTIALPDPGNAFVVAAPEGVPGDFVYARGGDLFALSAIDGQERLLQSLGPNTTIRGAAASFTGLLAVATDAGLTLIDMTVSPATTVISIPGSYTDVVFTDDSLSLAARRADGTWMAFER